MRSTSVEQLFLSRLEKARGAGEAEMTASGWELIKSANPGVPYDTGALQLSGSVAPVERQGERSSVEVYYGDTQVIRPGTRGRQPNATSNYAMIQHEKNPNGHANYLTDPLAVLKGAIKNRITNAYLKGLI